MSKKSRLRQERPAPCATGHGFTVGERVGIVSESVGLDGKRAKYVTPAVVRRIRASDIEVLTGHRLEFVAPDTLMPAADFAAYKAEADRQRREREAEEAERRRAYLAWLEGLTPEERERKEAETARVHAAGRRQMSIALMGVSVLMMGAMSDLR